jgi:hypothetical protein
MLIAASCVIAALLGFIITPTRTSPSTDAGRAASPTATRSTASDPVEVIARDEDDPAENEAWWQQLPTSVGALGLPTGVSCPQLRDWLHVRGGIDRGWSDITVAVRARKPLTVTFLAVRSRLVSRHSPTDSRTTLLCVPDSRSFVAGEYELPSTPGLIVDQAAGSYDFTRDGSAYPTKLGFGEITQIVFPVFAHTCDCTWRLEVEALINGQQRQWVLNDTSSGKPFHTIAPPPAPGDPSTNVVWCATSGHGRLTSPARRDCPIPVAYEGPIY